MGKHFECSTSRRDKTHFGLHHLPPPPPPRTSNSAIYKARQVGETLHKNRLNAKPTDLYYMGRRMAGYPDLNETVDIFFGMMNVIIFYNSTNPPILWNEIAKFDRILRNPEGRQ